MQGGNNQTSNTWTGVFSPTIHNLLSLNYIQRDYSNFEMFQYFEDYIDDNILEKIVTATNQTEMMKTQKNLGLTLRELKIFFGISMVIHYWLSENQNVLGESLATSNCGR